MLSLFEKNEGQAGWQPAVRQAASLPLATIRIYLSTVDALLCGTLDLLTQVQAGLAGIILWSKEL